MKTIPATDLETAMGLATAAIDKELGDSRRL